MNVEVKPVTMIPSYWAYVRYQTGRYHTVKCSTEFEFGGSAYDSCQWLVWPFFMQCTVEQTSKRGIRWQSYVVPASLSSHSFLGPLGTHVSGFRSATLVPLSNLSQASTSNLIQGMASSTTRWRVATLLLSSLLIAQHAYADKYIEAFSEVPWQEFPGGRYKASTNATLTASTIAGALFDLKPGGIRELHWHDVAEWAMVISGTCRGTAVNEGRLHPSDTWDFTEGDLWYFPRNVPHSVVGLAPDGCTFITGYNSPDFDELNAFSASSWLTTINQKTLAQALGIPPAAALNILDSSKSSKPTFIARGEVAELSSDQASLPVQFPQLIHRFQLLQNTHEVENPDGSYINMADVKLFPVATDMSGALVRIAPGGMRQLHWHLNFDEWQFAINGTFEVGVFTAPGQSFTNVLKAGDLGFAPRGSGHYVKNIGSTAGHVVLIFNAGEFTNVDVVNFLGAFPPSWAARSLNISTAAAKHIDYKLAGFAPKPGVQPTLAPVHRQQKPSDQVQAS